MLTIQGMTIIREATISTHSQESAMREFTNCPGWTTMRSCSVLSTIILCILFTGALERGPSTGPLLCSAMSTSFPPGPLRGKQQSHQQQQQQEANRPPVSVAKPPPPCPFFVIERLGESVMSYNDDADGNPHAVLQAMSQLCKASLGKNGCSNTEMFSAIDPASFKQRLEECADANEMYVAYEMRAVSSPGMPPPEHNLFVRAKGPSRARQHPQQYNPLRDEEVATSPPLVGVFMDMDAPLPRSHQRPLQRFDPSQQRRTVPPPQRLPERIPPLHYDFYDDKERVYYAKGDLVGVAEISHQPYSLGHFDLEGRATVEEANRRPVVNHLVVAERARTSGIGTRLLEACEKHILEFWRMDELTVEVTDGTADNEAGDDSGGALKFLLNREFDIIFSDYTYDSSNHGTNRRVLRKFFGPMARTLKQQQEQKKRENQSVESFGAAPNTRQRPPRTTGTIVDVSFTDDEEISYSFEDSTKHVQQAYTSSSPEAYSQASVRCDPIGLKKGIF